MFAYKKELLKLSRKKKIYVFTILTILAAMLRYGGNILIRKISDGQLQLRTNIAMEFLPFAVEIVVPIIILTAAADLFAHESAEGTLKACLLQPVNRFKLLTAKAGAILTAGVASLMVIFAATTIITLIGGGVGASGIATALAAYLIDILPLIGIVFLGVFINTLVGNAAMSTLVSLGAYAALKYLGLYVSHAGAALFTASALLHRSLLGVGLPLHIIIYKFGILFGSIAILYALSFMIFDKKSI